MKIKVVVHEDSFNTDHAPNYRQYKKAIKKALRKEFPNAEVKIVREKDSEKCGYFVESNDGSIDPVVSQIMSIDEDIHWELIR